MSEVKTQPKRLVDLDPRWVKLQADGVMRERAGVSYTCPCDGKTFVCSCDDEACGEVYKDCPWGGRVVIIFVNPADGLPAFPPSATRWERSGDTFETLTLAPSVHQVGHWHGYVRAGIVESC